MRFLLRHTPDSIPVELDARLVEGGYTKRIIIAAEDSFGGFRGSQIQVTLDDLDAVFTTGKWAITGGEEISVVDDDNNPRWSGTVDPELIERDPDQGNLKLRVLQHGSLLNTIEASLPDWRVVDNELVIDQDTRHRWKGEADNWQRTRDHDDNNRYHNDVADEKAQVYYTPSAKDALTDELYKAKFATKVHHFHTAGKNIGDVEYPFYNVDGNPPRWTGQFKPHYRPNFDLADPRDWEEEQNGVTQDSGSYLRNSEPVLSFRRQPISSIIAELVAQFNRTAKFPLLFDPSTDCVIVSPQIEQQIELLERQPNVDFIDIHLSPGTSIITPRLYLLVNYLPDDGSPAGAVSLYCIENETELTPLVEHYILPQQWLNGYCWPTFPRGLRFGRNPNNTSGTTRAYAYTMRYDVLAHENAPNGVIRFTALWFFVSNQNLTVQGPITATVTESLGDYPNWPDGFVANRSAALGNTSFTLRTSGQPNPPEPDPQLNFEYNNRLYTSRQGGLTVSGALFDRVAVDAENVKLSALISDLAKLTHSRWWVTPDRRLKFISRLHTGARLQLNPARTTELRTFTRRYRDIDTPQLGTGLVVPENFRRALDNWFQDHVANLDSPGFETTVPAEDINGIPTINDAVILPDPAVPVPTTDRARRYDGAFLLDTATLDLDNDLITIEASIPTV